MTVNPDPGSREGKPSHGGWLQKRAWSRTPKGPRPGREASEGGSATRPSAYREHWPWIAGTSAHPAISIDFGDAEWFRLIAVSIVGARHVSSGEPREDAYAARITREGVVACATDGLSSTPGSRVAAMLVADHLTAALAQSSGSGALWDDRCQRAIGRAGDGVKELTPRALDALHDALILGHADSDRPSAPATTLAAVEISRGADGPRLNWLVLGDTEVLTVDPAGGGIQRLSHTEADLLSDAPDRIGVKGVSGRWRTGSTDLDPLSWVLVASDGAVDGPLGLYSRDLADTLRQAPASTEKLAMELLTLLIAPVQGAHDDRTVVAIGPASGGPASPGRGSRHT